MKTFLPFLLTIVVVTAAAAAPSRSDNHKLKDGEIGKNMPDVQHFKRTSHHHTQGQKKKQLEEIMNHINVTKKKLSKQILDKHVPDVFQKSCTPEELCKAGKVLATFKAKDLGLEKEEWILHRQLLAYTKGTDCSETQTETVGSTLSSLLQNIHKCAQKTFSELTPPS
ncbi:hypothetical protein SRHO_G00096470 [Serrasalmus rhombeus]